MSFDRSLNKIRKWPRWTIIPLGILLAGMAIALGLLLEPAGYALSPVQPEPTATLQAINYSRSDSDGCHDCHVSLPALQASADDPMMAESYLIEPESVMTAHGTLGCVACHDGDGHAEDKEAGHEGLTADPTEADPKRCIICHIDLPAEVPGDRLRVPHELVEYQIVHGDPETLFCSDCHGGVGHGFDPVSGEKHCPMKVCLDCHEERDLEVQMTDCDACHIGPHDVAVSLTCDDCHASIETWTEIHSHVHPVELQGKHGEVACFDCHQYPNFKGLNVVCSDCHVSGHTDWGEDECAECHDAGATWDLVADTWPEHVERWDQYKGQHTKVGCQGCHFETFTDLDPNCTTCHTAPDSHEDDGRIERDCTDCHQADQPWSEG